MIKLDRLYDCRGNTLEVFESNFGEQVLVTAVLFRSRLILEHIESIAYHTLVDFDKVNDY